ncbi:MAG: nucleic acid-binding protein [Treponema sp.]|nr:nucleic acid-binding protein [Treponema sp.]MBD5435935.1 nucleic acid-binding protein [Treponema sp.]MBD5437455.1 nucleic acid-binding protein [Treponema sp.]MBD5440025.1 nucleic acid-binding protein [Treponema sp.]MBD5441215.1 nucleic acid-binding protein [Treponema sp.]
MNEVLESLKKLQDILAQKYALKRKIEEAPKQLGSQEELLSRLKKEYIEKNSKYEALKERISEIKDHLEEAVKSREAGEKGMDSISTHREYEILDKQIAEATERESALRRELQKVDGNFAELNENIKADENWIELQEKELNEARASLDKETNSLRKELSALEKKEAAIAPGLDQEIVYKFQRIIQRNSEGIVAVKGGVCGGCHMILPAQFANEVHDGEKILFCPYCSRILFYQETKEDEEEYFAMNDAGSLLDLDDEFDEDDEKEDEIEDDEFEKSEYDEEEEEEESEEED